MLPKTISVLILLVLWNTMDLGVNCQEMEHVTCDFDLLDENMNILAQLPEKCQEIYELNEANEISQMTQESLLFQKFVEDLEKREDPDYTVAEDVIPVKDWEYRNELYTAAELNECSNRETSKEFIECLIERRQMMIDAVGIVI